MITFIANVYLIQETLIEARVKIFDLKTKTVPEKSKLVAFQNSILHSLFDKLTLTINDYPITLSPDGYAYKAYLIDTLTYSTESKESHLQSHGFSSDQARFFNSTLADQNEGFATRCNWLRQDANNVLPYRDNGAVFIGKLYHDLIGCQTGLPPGVRVKITLTKSDPKFAIQKDKSDEDSYGFEILNCCLYVPIAQLQMSVYNELSTYMSRKSEARAVSIHFRRLELRKISLPFSKRDYYSGTIFSDSDLPCKVILMFVEADAVVGVQSKNPFSFRRLH